MKQDYKYFIKSEGYCHRSMYAPFNMNFYLFCKNECIFKNGNNCKYDFKYRYKYAKLYLKIIKIKEMLDNV
jgi:hypothetical protein